MATSHKLSEEARTTVPYEMKEELKAMAHEAGCDFSDVLRDIIYMARRGMTFGEHVANHRRAVLAGKADSLGGKGAT